jgi:hypothetical protein
MVICQKSASDAEKPLMPRLTWEHGVAASQDYVLVELLAKVNVTLHDCIAGHFVDAIARLVYHVWAKQRSREPEALTANVDYLHKQHGNVPW